MGPAPPRPHLERRPGRAHGVRGALASIPLLALCALLAAPPAAAAIVPTNGLERVTVSSFQALPPPYRPGHIVLKSARSLLAFEATLRADHIGTTSRPTSSDGCAGGTQYTVVMTYKAGRRTSLDAYDCASSITGNMTGKVKRFVGYLAALVD